MIKICVDAGHGGKDPGAVGPTGLEEATVALAIARQLAMNLESIGCSTKLTRSTDVFIELYQRCEIANDWGASYFISVHLNSDGPTAVGIETLYKTSMGKVLAEPVQEALISATGDTNRGLKVRNDLAVLNGTRMPAILPEVGFISNPDTETRFRSIDYQHTIARAIWDGVAKFLEI